MSYDIYTHWDPRYHTVRYVGISGDSARRYQQHLSLDVNEERGNWLSGLEVMGLRPVQKIIDTVGTREEARLLEDFWIQWLRQRGANLLNKTGRYLQPELVTKILTDMHERTFGKRRFQAPINEGEAIATFVRGIIHGQLDEIPLKMLALIEYRYATLYCNDPLDRNDRHYATMQETYERLFGMNLQWGRQSRFERGIPDEGPILSSGDLRVGDRVHHPEHGNGAIVGEVKAKTPDGSHAQIFWEDGTSGLYIGGGYTRVQRN